jgi:membrane protein
VRWLGGLGVKDVAGQIYQRLWDHQLLDRAASLSYYFLFALFPALLFLTALVGLVPMPDVIGQLLGYADRVLPRDAASMVRRTLDEVIAGARGSLLSVGVLAALWGASSGMASIMGALNTAFEIRDERSWWTQRAVALGLTVLCALFTLTALLLMGFGPEIGAVVARRVGLGPLFTLLWNVLQWPVVILVVLTGIALLNSLAPAGGRPWAWATPGAVLALLAWLLMSFGLRVYLANFGDYNATYGSIGGVILLMLWLYWSSLALFIGAEIDAIVERAAVEPAP